MLGPVQSMPPVFFLMGPTATGKTQLTLEIAQRFPIEVISVDAGQVYREMDIGTAKPSREVTDRVPHQLIDIRSPWEHYSAGQFRKDALVEIENALRLKRIPFLVGGTSFYFRALEHGLSELPQRTEEIRRSLTAQAKIKGWPHLHRQLMQMDEDSARQVSPNDSQRILRLLEMCMTQTRLPSEIKRSKASKPLPYRLVKLAVARADRDSQNQMIRQRFLEMLDDGLLTEAEKLYQSEYFDLSLPSMRSVGYRQMWQYFQGTLNYQQMVSQAVRETCGIAKRQLTWIRNQAGVIWTLYGDQSRIDSIAQVIKSMLPTQHDTEL